MEMIGNILVAVSGIAWTIVYMELIRTGFKEESLWDAIICTDFKSGMGSDLRCRWITCQQILYLCTVGCKCCLGLL